MRSRLALFVLGLTVASGLILLFHQRFQSSDLYPRYSSLRGDPRGLKILFDGLRETGALDVERGYRAFGEWHGNNTAWIVAGVEPYWWLNSGANLQMAEHLARMGNRLVISLDEQASYYDRGDLKDRPLAREWGVTVKAIPQEGPDDGGDNGYRPWPFALQAGKEWRILREESGHAVAIERAFDTGSVVLMASSWLLTNEAMVDDRQSAFLLVLLGGKPHVRFDETHLGMEQTGTILALARRFRLQGLLFGISLTAGLFIWRNVLSFPPQRERGVSSPAAGRDSLGGLALLLQRHLPEHSALAVCLRERERTGEKRLEPGLLQQMQIVTRTAAGTVSGFTAVQDLLHSKRKSL